MSFRDDYAFPAEEIEAGRRLRAAVADATPFAVSKLGFSEQALCVMPERLARLTDARQRRALEQALIAHATTQIGVFPASVDAALTTAEMVSAALGLHDVVALAPGMWVDETTRRLPAGTLTPALDCLDVRSADPCHVLQVLLDALSGKRVLLVTTPAEFLCERAEPGTFERVWRALGRRWFAPLSVEALAIPNAYDVRTQESFADTAAVVRGVTDAMGEREFDVALIGAGAVGPILAAETKRMGAVGVSLGSQLQLLVGVHGRRWMSWQEFQTEIVNDDWVMLPEHFRPAGAPFAADHGAYWA